MINVITPIELKTLLEQHKNTILIDVREKWEYDIVHLEGSILMPVSNFQNLYTRLKKKDNIVVYCHHGIRSMNVCEFLANKGFNNLYDLDGGIEVYADEIDPAMTKY